MAEHEHVIIHDPFSDCDVEIDKGIAELVKILWTLGIETFNSCEDNHGSMWLEFPCTDAERFLTIVASERESDFAEEGFCSLYNRMTEQGEESAEDQLKNWDYRVGLWDLSEMVNEEDEVYHEGDSVIEISVSVRFPQPDYPLVLERLKKWLGS